MERKGIIKPLLISRERFRNIEDCGGFANGPLFDGFDIEQIYLSNVSFQRYGILKDGTGVYCKEMESFRERAGRIRGLDIRIVKKVYT